MGDPYKVLGISPSATDDEVKAAYRALAKKYHPDNYADNPLNDLAAEKMKEINEAYDAIVRDRKNGTRGRSTSGNTAYGQQYSENSGYSNSNYSDVRNMIYYQRIADAEQILDGVPFGDRDAEWYYLKGVILQKHGWMDDALTHFQTACQRDPNNMEYRTAVNNMQAQRGNYYGGYRTGAVNRSSGCDNGCDICSSLLCADCCCECMGGDLIPCC